jgi:hypothetical protein
MESNLASSMATSSAADGIIDKMYEPKENKKFFRIVTVIAYVFCVSMVAILLSLYYLFLWNPYIKQHKQEMAKLLLQEELERLQQGLSNSSVVTTDLSSTTIIPRALALVIPTRRPANLVSLLEWSRAATTSQEFTSKGDRLEDPFTTYAKGTCTHAA